MPFQPLGGAMSSMPTIQGAPQINPMAGLSQVMQLIGLMSTLQNRAQMQDLTQLRMLDLQDKMENGRSDKERERILKDRYLKEYATRVVDNPDFIEESRSAMKLSPGRREKAFEKIRDKYIEPLKGQYDSALVKPKDVYNYLFYDKVVDARLKAKEIEDARWSGFWDDLKADAAHVAAGVGNLVPGLDTKDLAAWATEQKQKAIENNIWLQDQELRRRQGEGFLDQPAPDMARTILTSMPTILGYTMATTAGTMAGGPLGGAAAAGALGGGMSDVDYVTQVMNSNADDETKEAALAGWERAGNTLAGAAFGALAPSIARPFRSVRSALSSSYKPMAPATSRLFAGARQSIDTAAGMGLMGAGQQAVSNVALNSALNQNTPWYRGTLDAAAQGALLGLPMGGVLGARSYRPTIPPTTDPGSNLQRPPTGTPPPTPTEPRPGLPPASNPSPASPQNNRPNPNGSPNPPENNPVPPSDVQLSGMARQADQALDSILSRDPRAEFKQLHNKIFNENKSVQDILNDNEVPDSIKAIFKQDMGVAEPTLVTQAGRVITPTARAKKDSTVIRKIALYLGSGENALTYNQLLNRRTSYAQALDDALGKNKIDQAAHDRLRTKLDEAFEQVVGNRFETEGALDAYVKAKASESQGTSGSPSDGLSNDSGTPAGAAAAATNAANGVTPETSSNSQAAPSGEPNGTPPPNDGTTATDTGTSQGTGPTPPGGQAGRAGDATVSDPSANAGTGEPSVTPGEQPNGGQPETTFGRGNSDAIADFLATENISEETFTTLYNNAASDLYDARGQALSELSQAEQLDIIKSYVDAMRNRAAAEDADPTNPLCV